MAQTKEQKQGIVKDLKENIDKQKSMVFVAVEGLGASDLFSLRSELKKEGCLLKVAKKTLLEKSFSDVDFRGLKGQLAVIFSFKDEIAPCRISYQFSRTNESLKILGGFFENKVRTLEEIVALAKIPSRQELLAKVVSSISSPISGFANALQGNLRNLVFALSNIKS